MYNLNSKLEKDMVKVFKKKKKVEPAYTESSTLYLTTIENTHRNRDQDYE